MKKVAVLTAVVAISMALIFALAACGKAEEDNFSGKDVYDRDLGGIYDIDSEETGVFRLPYEIGDTSVMGKTMISSNCADYVQVEKTAQGYRLTYYCKEGMLGAVKIITAGGEISGTESEDGSYQGFTFEVSKEDLESKINLSCVVTVMNKTVEYSIKPDLTKAKLVG